MVHQQGKSPLARVAIVLAVALVGLLCGLAADGWIHLGHVAPNLVSDSEMVLARGYPHPWLVLGETGYPSLETPLVATANLVTSIFFWLAASALFLGISTWRPRTRQQEDELSGRRLPRAVLALITAVCAATYAHLFAGFFDYTLLLSGTAAVLVGYSVFVPRRSRRARLWLMLAVVAVMVTSFLSSERIPLGMVAILGFYLLGALAVVLALISWAEAGSPPSRAGWSEKAQGMSAEDDDRLLDTPHPTAFDRNDWTS